MHREHPTTRFAACKQHFSAMMSDLLVERGETKVIVKVIRIREPSSVRPTYVCSCRRRAAFFVTTDTSVQSG